MEKVHYSSVLWTFYQYVLVDSKEGSRPALHAVSDASIQQHIADSHELGRHRRSLLIYVLRLVQALLTAQTW